MERPVSITQTFIVTITHAGHTEDGVSPERSRIDAQSIEEVLVDDGWLDGFRPTITVEEGP
jgi:hypothetical protein